MATVSPPTGAGDQQSAPIFVVGSMRSGSTMLRLMLDSHPNIAIGGETGFMGGLAAAKDIPGWNFGKGWYERIGWTDEEMDTRLRDFYDGMFRRHAWSEGKRRWGEKTPFHTEHMEQMATVFPDAVFVGIVRHPGGVAASLRKRFHYTFRDALAYWRSTNLAMLRAAAGLGQRFALCRYEDLVLDGEPVLRELMDFLHEPWAPELLEHHRVQKQKGSPRAAEGSTIAHAPVDSRRAVEWAHGARSDDVRDLEVVAPLCSFFGYHPTEPAVQESSMTLSGGSHRLPRGDDLARRRDQWRARVDFDERAAAVVVDADPRELAARLARAEQALARARSRRAVRAVDAFRKLQHGRSISDARAALSIVRGGAPVSGRS